MAANAVRVFTLHSPGGVASRDARGEWCLTSAAWSSTDKLSRVDGAVLTLPSRPRYAAPKKRSIIPRAERASWKSGGFGDRSQWRQRVHVEVLPVGCCVVLDLIRGVRPARVPDADSDFEPAGDDLSNGPTDMFSAPGLESDRHGGIMGGDRIRQSGGTRPDQGSPGHPIRELLRHPIGRGSDDFELVVDIGRRHGRGFVAIAVAMHSSRHFRFRASLRHRQEPSARPRIESVGLCATSGASASSVVRSERVPALAFMPIRSVAVPGAMRHSQRFGTRLP
jgi:hypothetical protein